MSSKSQDVSKLSEREKERRTKMEIRKLQTQYHHAAYKRKKYDIEIWRQIEAQQKAIDGLNQERRHVSLMLSQVYSPNNVILENRNRVKVQTLLQTKIQNEALIKERKAQLADLVRQVLELEKQITKQREITGRALQARNHKRLQEQINALECYLNRLTVHYNTILAQLDKLREEIRSLRIQKAIFDEYYWKYEKQLTQQNRELNASVEVAAKDHKRWLGTLSKISRVREARCKNTTQYNAKVLKLKSVLQNETRLKNFYLTKRRDLSNLKEQAKQRKALRAAALAKRRQEENYESVYKQLLELSGGDINQLLGGIVETERKFLILFAHAVKLNVRNEYLKQKIKRIQNDMAAITKEQAPTQAARVNVLQELKAKLTETTEKANHYEAKCKESSKLLEQLKSRMQSLQTRIDCDKTKTEKALGSNLLALFGPVEKKIDEFLMLEALLRFTSIDDAHQSQSFISPMSGNSRLLWVLDRKKLCPLPPSLDSADPGTAEELLCKDQLYQMVIKRHG